MGVVKRQKERVAAAAKALAMRHPLVKIGADRNVRDAYLRGIVFAAIDNDNAIDESERAYLDSLSAALGMSAREVESAIHIWQSVDDAEMMSLVEDFASQLRDVSVAECFIKEFGSLWSVGGGDEEELAELMSRIIGWMGGGVKEAIEAKKKADREAKRRKVEEERRREREQRQEVAMKCLEAKFDAIVKKYGNIESVSIKSLTEIADMMSELDRDSLDWCSAVNGILEKQLSDEQVLAKSSKYTYRRYGVWNARQRIRREAVWKVIALLMLEHRPQKTRLFDEMNSTVRKVGRSTFQESFLAMINAHMRKRVVVK